MDMSERRATIRAVVMVASGNFLEMYDFMVFGYYAGAIGSVFFPTASEFASLMLSLMTFGAGFLMRPVGAIVLGAYMDRHGRRAGLLLTLGLMAVGTFTIAALPGYAVLGVLAPVLVLLSRLVQGLSAGVEVGGVSVYLSEIATPGRRGFYVSWQSASQQAAVVFAAVLGIVVSSNLTREQMLAWGWRIPLLVGCVLIPFIFLIRRSLVETAAFTARQHRPDLRQVVSSLVANWRIVLLGTMLAAMTTVSFYLITAYTPTFGSVELKLRPVDNMIVTMCVGVSNFILLPIMGSLSDRIGRRRQLIACAAIGLLSAYPALSWLVVAPSFERLLAVLLWLSVVYSGYNGAMVVYLTEIMPANVRTTGFSLAYSSATAVLGGFTPAIATWMIHLTGNKAAPGLWLSFAAILGLTAAVLLRRAADDVAHAPAPELMTATSSVRGVPGR